MRQVIEWILHVDRHLRELMDAVGAPWLYTLLFLIVFCETGLVIMPFLPGDSLLFAAGTLCVGWQPAQLARPLVSACDCCSDG